MKQIYKVYLKNFLLLLFFKLSYNDSSASFLNKSGDFTNSSFPNKNDSLKSRLPFLTFHVGCALAFPETKFQFLENTKRENSIHLQNDLLHPANYYVPKLNVMIAIKNYYRFTSDIFFALTTNNSLILKRDIQLGNHVFNNNTAIYSRFNFFAGNFSYIHPLHKNKKCNLGALFGLAGAHAFIKVNGIDENILFKRSLWFVNPIIGLDVYGFITEKIFYRTAVKFSASPINNYSFTYFTFKPYIEYHIFKNIGLGLRMDYMNISIKDIDQKKFKGGFKMELPVVSLVGVYRIFNNR